MDEMEKRIRQELKDSVGNDSQTTYLLELLDTQREKCNTYITHIALMRLRIDELKEKIEHLEQMPDW